MQGRCRGDGGLARGDLVVDLVDETAQRRRALARAARGAGSGGQEVGLGSYLRYISATSPLYLRYISAISPLYLPPARAHLDARARLAEAQRLEI